jgi:hypothetical protein
MLGTWSECLRGRKRLVHDIRLDQARTATKVHRQISINVWLLLS